MRYPKPVKKGGTIGFVAPSFGCATEPYKTAFDESLKRWHKLGYNTILGPNCYADDGIGISSSPENCGRELAEAYTDSESDVLIACGGGELMCEILDHIDFEKIAVSAPKWYMGYSDNTNFTFTLATLCDVASVYGPCASNYGTSPLHRSHLDAMSILTGRIITPEEANGAFDADDSGVKDETVDRDDTSGMKVSGAGGVDASVVTDDGASRSDTSVMTDDRASRSDTSVMTVDRAGRSDTSVMKDDGDSRSDTSVMTADRAGITTFRFSGYGMWEKEGFRDEEHPLAPLNLTEKTVLHRFMGDGDVLPRDPAERKEPERLTMHGRLLGGCLDCLVNLCGTKYDQVSQFNNKYRRDGVLWFIEACDLNVMAIRRAMWELEHAGWFDAASGFIIGRPRMFDEPMMGLDQYMAVYDIISHHRVPILMDADVGHLNPMIPLITGSYAYVTSEDDDWSVEMKLI